MEKKLIVSASPHIGTSNSTKRLMLDVIIALLPALALSVIFYGNIILLITLVAIVSCVAFEWIIAKMMKKEPSITDCSAILTGLLIAFNLPSSIPLWLVVLGSLVAIGLGKMTYGGLGHNIFNPALVGRVFLLIAFPVQMTYFPDVLSSPEVFSGATPLAYFKEAMSRGQNLQEMAQSLPLVDMISDMKRGSVGEVSSIALLAGFVYLLIRKVITWHIPIAILGTMFVFGGVMFLVDPKLFMNPLTHIFTGGAILGAIFMATDYVTSPMSKWGMIIFGVGIGLITMFVRIWGAYPEGISFAILILNAFVPLINKYVKPKRFGERKTAAQ